jgi:hypothetical protein
LEKSKTVGQLGYIVESFAHAWWVEFNEKTAIPGEKLANYGSV